ERMKEIIARPRPVAISDAQLEGAFHLPHDLILVDAQQPDEVDNRGNGGFAYAHRADLFGLDQADVAVEFFQMLGKARCRHPAGCAAADNHNAADRIEGHWPSKDLCCKTTVYMTICNCHGK